MKAVLYFRVSTSQQERSGLGIDAQRHAVEQFCATRGCNVLGEYVETESGKRNDRPELAKALHHAKITGSTVVIAKLDRLSRNAAFLLTLRDSGAKFVAADMPDANNLTVGILAIVAEQEREATSKRTREALAAAKARGARLGNPNGAVALRRAAKGNAAAIQTVKARADAFAEDLRTTVDDIRRDCGSRLTDIAYGLNSRGIETARGGKWHPTTVKNLLARLAA